jgi:hypothetical protein
MDHSIFAIRQKAVQLPAKVLKSNMKQDEHRVPGCALSQPWGLIEITACDRPLALVLVLF